MKYEILIFVCFMVLHELIKKKRGILVDIVCVCGGGGGGGVSESLFLALALCWGFKNCLIPRYGRLLPPESIPS